MKICFSQHAEDLVLARALGLKPAGFYVDVGAAHHTELSVTRLFYERGWHGINIEPLPHMFAALQKARPRDVNLQLAISDHPGVVPFYRVAATDCDEETIGTRLSTFDTGFAADYRARGFCVEEIKMQVVTLNDVLRPYQDRTIDFLKLDIEGHEPQALAGLDLTRYRPRILLIEAVKPLTSIDAFSDWEPAVLRSGYQFAMSDGVNRYYVRDEDAELAENLHPLDPPQYLRLRDYKSMLCVKRWTKPWEIRLKKLFSGRKEAA